MQFNQATMDNFRRVRATDVADALDSLGVLDLGIVDPGVRPVWKPVKLVGIAKTIVLVPRQAPWAFASVEDYLMQTQVGYVHLKQGEMGVREWKNPLDEYLRMSDADGVVVVPQEKADEIAERALRIFDQDLIWRRLRSK